MHLVDITMFYAAEGGGVNTYLNAKARWLAQRGLIRHTILSSSISAPVLSASALALPSFAIPGVRGYRMPRSIGGPARLIHTLAPDLIEAGDACQCAWAALRAARRLRVPAVAFYHSDLAALVERRFGAHAANVARAYLGQLYRQFDLVLAPSELMTRALGAMGVAQAAHQPLGIDSWTFCPQRRDPSLRSQLQLAPNTRLLVYAGRFTPEKKLHLLIAAVRKLGKPYHLLLIGSGDDSLPRTRELSFIPFVRDLRLLARLLASCDALVHPGDCETFGLIVLEAMACGLPVVGADGGGVAELVDEDSGVLVAPDSVEALCAGIEALYWRDRARLGANARRKAAGRYDWRHVMPQLLRHYCSLLAARQRAQLEAHSACLAD
ncbi:MAG: glycosyltransferase [Pseudomonadota bacterium]